MVHTLNIIIIAIALLAPLVTTPAVAGSVPADEPYAGKWHDPAEIASLATTPLTITPPENYVTKLTAG